VFANCLPTSTTILHNTPPSTLLFPISSSLVASTPIHHSTFSIICKKPTPNPQFYSSKNHPLRLGLNNAFAFTQYSKMFSPFVKCMHLMCFLMVGTTWSLKDYFSIHHFLISLLLMLINLHLWILLTFQYAQINSFISSWQWFWHSWCNCIHSSQMYVSMNTILSIFTINSKDSTWCSLSMFPLVYH